MTTRQGQAVESGFTLLEMLVVLAVLGLMAGLVIARGPMRSAGLDSRMAANQVAGLLRGARSEAIAADRPVIVAIDSATGTVRVGAAAPRSVGASIGSLTGPLVFLPDGSSRGGSLTIGSATARKRVTVDWLTGRVSITDAS